MPRRSNALSDRYPATRRAARIPGSDGVAAPGYSQRVRKRVLVVLKCLGVPPQEIVGKAENLQTVRIADDPEIQLVPFAVGGGSFHEARHTSLLFDSSIDARRPAARS